MAAKLLSLYLLAVVGLGIVDAGTPSAMVTLSNESLTTSASSAIGTSPAESNLLGEPK